MPKKTQNTQPTPEATAPETAPEATPPSQPPSAAPADEHNGKAAAPALTGLRGADYIQALSGQPLASIDVPLLPNERRGDWQRARGVKIRVTSRQLTPTQGASASPVLEGAHALAALIIELQRPGSARFDHIDLHGSQTKEAIERLSDHVNQARLRAQAQTGKKWTASQVYLVPQEDA